MVMARNCLDSSRVIDVLSTGGRFPFPLSKDGRLLKLVDRADLGSVGDEP
jgi:hypothetical protein